MLSASVRKSITDLSRRRARTGFTIATLALAVASISFLAIPAVIDASMPWRNSSTTMRRPATPNAESTSSAWSARSACTLVMHTKVPRPPAMPSALMTTGPRQRLIAARAACTSLKASQRAVGTWARSISSLA